MKTVKEMFGGAISFIRKSRTSAADTGPPPAPSEGSSPAEVIEKKKEKLLPLMSREMDGLCQHGLKAARDADEVSQNPVRRAVLHEYAAARIRSLYKGPFDQINRPEDAAIQEALDASKARERKLDNDLLRATSARSEAQRGVPADQPPPRVSLLVVSSAVIGFALAFGSSINELPLLQALDDDGMALILSFAIGGALGVLCVCSMFGLKVHEEKASASWSPKPENPAWQIIAGLVMIAAFGLIRSYGATGPRDWLITFGLMGVDTAVLLYAKGEATRHREREDVWTQRCDGRHQKLLLAEVTERQCAAIEADLEKAKAERGALDARFEARLQHDFQLEAMTQAGVSAIDEGYFLGIDLNTGRFTAGNEQGVAA